MRHFKILLLGVCLALWGAVARGQPDDLWNGSYGTAQFDSGFEIAVHPDGGFVVAGFTNTPNGVNPGNLVGEHKGFTDVLVMRFDDDGNVLWQTIFGGAGDDRATAVIVDRDGSIVVCGASNSSPVLNSPDKTVKSSPLYSTESTVVTGFLDPDMLVVKLSAEGEVIWDATFGSNNVDVGVDLAQLDNDAGDYVIGGYSVIPRTPTPDPVLNEWQGGPNQQDYYVVRVNRDGELIRQRVFGGDGQDLIETIEVLGDGTIMAAGQSSSAANAEYKDLDPFDVGVGGVADCWVVELSPVDLLPTAQYQFGGNALDVPSVIEEFENGDILLGMRTTSTTAGNGGNFALAPVGDGVSEDAWVVRFRRGVGEGERIVWQRIYGGENRDDLQGAAINSNGYILYAGMTRSDNRTGGRDGKAIKGDIDLWFFYTDSEGEVVWDLTDGGDGEDNCRDIVRSPRNTFYVVGENSSDAAGFRWKDDDLIVDPVQGFPANDIWVAELGCDFEFDFTTDDSQELDRLDPVADVCAGDALELLPTYWNRDFSAGYAGTLDPEHTTWRWVNATDPETAIATETNLRLATPVEESYELTIVTADACEITHDVAVDVHEAPSFEVDPEDASCGGTPDGALTVTLGEGAVAFEVDAVRYDESATVTDLAAGDYLVTASAEFEACTDTATATIGQAAGFSVEPGDESYAVASGTRITIEPQVTGGGDLSYAWSGYPDLCASCPVQNDLAVRTDGTITLVVTDLATDCDPLTFTYEVVALENRRVGVADAFSPNNDGQNDNFGFDLPASVAVAGPLRIFDRWGIQVYAGVGAGVMKDTGWDGTYRGDEVGTGVYVYVCPILFEDGTETVYKGSLTLMR